LQVTIPVKPCFGVLHALRRTKLITSGWIAV
jgi:hypothetical protein